MNLSALITLENATVAGTALILGIAAGWMVAKLHFLKKYTDLEVQNGSAVAVLNESIRSKIEELSDKKSRLENDRAEIDALNQRLLSMSQQRSAAEAKLERMAALESELTQSREQAGGFLAEITRLKQRTTELETRMAEERKSFTEKIALLEDMKNRLTDTYQSLSAAALEKNNRSFLELAGMTFSKYMDSAKTDFEQRSDAVRNIVDPVREALNKYDQQIRAVEREREKAYGGLSEQVVSLLKSQTELQKETGKLVKAMRIPHVRGRWGEITLRRTAELSGMVNHCDFFEQPVSTSEGGPLRPDMMVCLPGERRIIVDAKVPIIAYLDALEAETDEIREKLLDDHAGHVMNHIRQLAQKNYWHQFDPSPEFVVMFIPGENFFSAALTQYPELIEFGVQRGVILATPTTLISLLKTVSFAWRRESAAENSRIIGNLGRELYERLNTMAKHVNKLGRDIDRCAQSYNQVLGSFERRVFSTARKFGELGIGLKDDKELMMIEPVETKARELIHLENDTGIGEN